jgi:hypothetical protein
LKKLTNLLFFIGVGYVLPLLGRPSLMVHGQIIVLMLATAIIVLTQPPIELSEAIEKEATDQYSVVWITGLALPSMIVPVVEWAYFKPHAEVTEPMAWILAPGRAGATVFPRAASGCDGIGLAGGRLPAHDPRAIERHGRSQAAERQARALMVMGDSFSPDVFGSLPFGPRPTSNVTVWPSRSSSNLVPVQAD